MEFFYSFKQLVDQLVHLIENPLDKFSCKNGTVTDSNVIHTNVSLNCSRPLNMERLWNDFERDFQPQLENEINRLRIQLAERFFKRFIYEEDVQFYRNRMLKVSSSLAYLGELQLRKQGLLAYLNDSCLLCEQIYSNQSKTVVANTPRSCIDSFAIESSLLHMLGGQLQQVFIPVRAHLDTHVQEYLKNFSSFLLLNTTHEFGELMFSNQTKVLFADFLGNKTWAAFQDCCHNEQMQHFSGKQMILL